VVQKTEPVEDGPDVPEITVVENWAGKFTAGKVRYP
jgi:hypothetical protein